MWCARRYRTYAASAPGKGKRKNGKPRRRFLLRDSALHVRHAA
jgi:hypothetical protein